MKARGITQAKIALFMDVTQSGISRSAGPSRGRAGCSEEHPSPENLGATQDLNGTEQPNPDHSIPRSPAGTWLYGLLKSIGPERSLDPRGVWTEAIEQETGFTWDGSARPPRRSVWSDPTSGMSPDRPDWRLPLVEFMEPGDGTLQLDPDAHGLPFMHTRIYPKHSVSLSRRSSTRLQLPAGMIATAGLVAAAAAIGSTRSVYTDDREHPAALWGVIVEYGCRKFTAMDVALSPYRSAARLTRPRDRLSWIDAAKWNKLKPERRRRSRRYHRSCSPATPPRNRWRSNWPRRLVGLLLDVDELTTWAAGMDAYRAKAAGPDRSKLLHHVEQPATRHPQRRAAGHRRASGRHLDWRHPPHALKSLNSAPDGLAQRMLYTYHMDLGQYPSDADPDHAVLAAWAGVIASLLHLDGDDRLKLNSGRAQDVEHRPSDGRGRDPPRRQPRRHLPQVHRDERPGSRSC